MFSVALVARTWMRKQRGKRSSSANLDNACSSSFRACLHSPQTPLLHSQGAITTKPIRSAGQRMEDQAPRGSCKTSSHHPAVWAPADVAKAPPRQEHTICGCYTSCCNRMKIIRPRKAVRPQSSLEELEGRNDFQTENRRPRPERMGTRTRRVLLGAKEPAIPPPPSQRQAP